MNKDFQKIFDQIESQRSDLLTLLAGLDNSLLTKTPGPGKWSIMEILAHVMTAEELSIRYMQKKVQGINDVRDSGLIEYLKLVALNMIQRAPLRYNAPKVVVAHTPTELSFPELIARWDENRRQLQKLLNSIPEHQTRRMIYRHVIVGRLNALQALHFFREHFEHHLPQVTKIINEATDIVYS